MRRAGNGTMSHAPNPTPCIRVYPYQALREGTVLLGCPLVHRVTQGTVHTLWVELGQDTIVF